MASFKVVYEVEADVLRAHAPMRGITVPKHASPTTKNLKPGWYVAELRGLSLDTAIMRPCISKDAAMRQVGGDPWEGYD